MQPEAHVSDVILRDAEAGDLDALVALSRKTFTDKFGHLYKPEDLSAFLDAEHGHDVYRTALATPGTLVRVGKTGDGALGAYLVCGPLTLPAEAAEPGAVELKRLYVDQPLQGRGLGTRLMEEAFAWAHAQNAPEMYLSVFSENDGARRLYERYGFEKIGEFLFPVGNHRDLEFLMRKPLCPGAPSGVLSSALSRCTVSCTAGAEIARPASGRRF
ncbi:GNAT family N-acetyltransferase [Henriciella aquimarina]|uniref:GNAT family N-acetyltransferase n=1 Tax=Henriciella aquimarina TaxID=545261 RepID=UPI0009FD7E3D|nr:GNAT family N-acetyltransferase [Henriciella aquimarina]